MSTSRKSKISKLLSSSKDITITVRISNDFAVQSLNREHLGRDFTTDVLSFALDEPDGDAFYLGDVLVNKDQARRQAKEYNNSTEEEIAELVAHGVLHLLEVHHPDDDDVSVHGKPITNS